MELIIKLGHGESVKDALSAGFRKHTVFQESVEKFSAEDMARPTIMTLAGGTAPDALKVDLSSIEALFREHSNIDPFADTKSGVTARLESILDDKTIANEGIVKTSKFAETLRSIKLGGAYLKSLFKESDALVSSYRENEQDVPLDGIENVYAGYRNDANAYMTFCSKHLIATDISDSVKALAAQYEQFVNKVGEYNKGVFQSAHRELPNAKTKPVLEHFQELDLRHYSPATRAYKESLLDAVPPQMPYVYHFEDIEESINKVVSRMHGSLSALHPYHQAFEQAPLERHREAAAEFFTRLRGSDEFLAYVRERGSDQAKLGLLDVALDQKSKLGIGNRDLTLLLNSFDGKPEISLDSHLKAAFDKVVGGQGHSEALIDIAKIRPYLETGKHAALQNETLSALNQTLVELNELAYSIGVDDSYLSDELLALNEAYSGMLAQPENLVHAMDTSLASPMVVQDDVTGGKKLNTPWEQRFSHGILGNPDLPNELARIEYDLQADLPAEELAAAVSNENAERLFPALFEDAKAEFGKAAARLMAGEKLSKVSQSMIEGLLKNPNCPSEKVEDLTQVLMDGVKSNLTTKNLISLVAKNTSQSIKLRVGVAAVEYFAKHFYKGAKAELSKFGDLADAITNIKDVGAERLASTMATLSEAAKQSDPGLHREIEASMDEMLSHETKTMDGKSLQNLGVNEFEGVRSAYVNSQATMNMQDVQEEVMMR